MSIRIINGKVYKNGAFSEEEIVLKKLEEQLTQAIETARIGNVSLEELQEMLALLYGGEES